MLSKSEMLENIKKAILSCDKKNSPILAQEAIKAGIDPLSVMDVLIQAINKVGEGFEKGELFLPELVGAAAALQNASPIIESEIKKRGQKRRALGLVVIGTVAKDLHTIGKSLVIALLVAEGFEVVDLGIDVPCDKFINSIKKYKPDILAMSALLSTTAPETQRVIEQLEKYDLRYNVKVIVGGGAITESYAKKIKADGYESTAPGAVNLVKGLLSKKG